MPKPQTGKSLSIFTIRNIRLFIAFRIFFTSRFYYPVFTILFLDFGLTLEQFALLNAVWAATIVLLEVPSGAMADVMGRRNLLVFSGATMIVEIALLCFAPRGSMPLLFIIFLINRIFSGAAEAAASGADEAIAYDTLKKHGLAQEWPVVLEKQMRLQSIVHIVSTSLGAVVYDPAMMQRVVGALGLHFQLTQGITLRFPLFLTLFMAFGALLAALHLREQDSVLDGECLTETGCVKSIMQAFRLTADAGRWILHTPFALVIIMMGLMFDHCIRMIITLASQYYRVIHLPEASFGIIASLISILGLFIPRIARRLVQRHSPLMSLKVMVGIALPGLIGMVFIWPIIGLIPMMLVFSVLYLLYFFTSHYLNRITASEQRATVLSLKGLSFNLAYGLFGLMYSGLLGLLQKRAVASGSLLSATELENMVFARSLTWFPGYFIFMLIALLIVARRLLKNSDIHRIPG
jgi:MFS family permease